MAHYWNPTLQGFPDDRIAPASQLLGAIRLSDAEYATLYQGLANGGSITVQNGKCVLIPAPSPTNDQLWVSVRKQRNGLLSQSDWTQLADVASDVKAAWAPYRQALRDIPQNNSNPSKINWPEAPQ